MSDSYRMRARFLCAMSLPGALVAAGACSGDQQPAAKEPTAVAVEPPPDESETEDGDASLPERGEPRAPTEAERTAVWIEGYYVCVNEAGSDPNSGEGFAGCFQRPLNDVVHRGDVALPCGPCYFRLEQEFSNSQRAAGKRSACCYRAISPPVKGRPLRDGEQALVAPLDEGGDWVEVAAFDVSALSHEFRIELAEAWAHDGLLEHASVASFAKLALDLLALAAPPELVEGAHRAALDEIEHARLCFGLASAYAGRAMGPGPLPMPASAAPSVEELAREIFRDGCVGETIAAVEAAAAARAARAPEVRAALERIARDEERHAELAWRALAWLVRERPSVRGVVERALREVGVTSAAGEREELAEHGRLDERARAAVAERTVESVIRPCARALMAVEGEGEANVTPVQLPGC